MSKMHNQTCSDSVYLERYLNEELSEHEEADVQQHISSCPDCQQALEKVAADKSVWDGLRKHATWISDYTETDDTDERIKRLIEYLAPTDDPQMIGRLGAYEICGIIGQGSTGIVLKALEPALNRFVAIKVMSPLFSTNGAARKRFAREGRAVAAVSHEHVVPIYAVSEYRDLPYIVMQYIPGVSLLQRIEKDGALETGDVARIGLQIAKGLAAAHAQGMVHRDVKPANVLLENTVDRAMVTDFGLARIADEASMTRSGTIAGTPQYMSPEQAQGETVDPRSDLFSLGSLMYAAATARPPFRAETVFGVISRVCNSAPRPIREINPKIDEWLASFIDKLMAKEPASRFQSATEVAETLASELAYAQNPTALDKPKREWCAQPQTSSSGGRRRFVIGLTTTACIAMAAFAISTSNTAGSWIAGMLAVGQQLDENDEQEPSTLEQSIPALTGFDEAKITWKKDEEEWSKDATLAFDQKIEASFAVEPGGKLVVDADIGDVVLRPGDTDKVKVSVLRRVEADSQQQAENILSDHKLSAVHEGQTVTIGGSAIVKNAAGTANNATKERSRQTLARRKFKRVLYRIEIPREFNPTIQTAGGDVSIGAITGDVSVTTAGGDVMMARIDGEVNLQTTGGQIDLGEGCTGNVVVDATDGNITLVDVAGTVGLTASGGQISLVRVVGRVNAKTKGCCVTARECVDAKLVTVNGLSRVSGATEKVQVMASGGRIVLGQSPGDTYGQISGGDIIVNEVAGRVRAFTSDGDLFVNMSQSPETESIFRANSGNVQLNIGETVAVDVDAVGTLDTPDGMEAKSDGSRPHHVGKFNGGGILVKAASTKGTVSVNTLAAAELKKSLGGSGGLGGSGLSSSLAEKSAYAIQKTTGSPRPGAIATVKLNEDDQMDGYTLYLPESYEKHDGKFAILVYLTGAYGVGGEIANVNEWGLTRLIRDESDLTSERNKLLLDSFIVVTPHIQGGDYHDSPDVMRKILDDMTTKYKGDSSRIYLTGLSRGGHGTWGLASRMPNTFAAINPIGSSPSPILDHGALASTAIWIAHNKGDGNLDHSEVAAAAKKIEEEGDVKFLHIDSADASGTDYLNHRHLFTEPDQNDHDAWTDMYCSVEFYKWLLLQERVEVASAEVATK